MTPACPLPVPVPSCPLSQAQGSGRCPSPLALLPPASSIRRVVCQTGEAQEAFLDVVTVNVSREGRSRERYSYVVSGCLLSISLVIPVPLKVSLQLPTPSAAG